jgi:hypothetical protein
VIQTSRLSLAQSPRHLSKPCPSVPRLLIRVLGRRETAAFLVCRSVGYNWALQEPPRKCETQEGFHWCAERDLNPHGIATTSPSNWRVCHSTTRASWMIAGVTLRVLALRRNRGTLATTSSILASLRRRDYVQPVRAPQDLRSWAVASMRASRSTTLPVLRRYCR